MTDQSLIDQFLKELVSRITQKFSAEIDFIILFGSAARGEFKKGVSDIDLVIQLKSGPKRKEIEDFATEIFWKLDEKYNTEFKKVLSTVQSKSFGQKVLKDLEKTTHLYVPIFVFPPGWLDWQKGWIQRPFWRPVAILLVHQTLIFEKFKYEGKILFGRDIRPQINPKITFWERWKALQIPFYISFFALIISPLFLKNSIKYSTKAILYQLDSVLGFLNIRPKDKAEKLESLQKESTSQIEFELQGFYIKSTLSLISKNDIEIFNKAILIKTKQLVLTAKDSRKFVLQSFWFILRSNWSVLIKRYITRRNLTKAFLFTLFLTAIIYFFVSFIATYKLTHQKLKPLIYTPQMVSTEYEIVDFPARFDGQNINGWFFQSGAGDKAIILVSGSEQNRIDPGFASHDVARDLINQGFNVLMFDFRGRGVSQPSVYTIGAFEKYDVVGAYDFLVNRGFEPQKIGIIAVSLGAGTSILALPIIPQIGGIVLDSPYADVHALVERELPGRSGLPKLFSWGISFWARVVYGVRFDEMVPKKILGNFQDKELLIIHGSKDGDIPFEDSIELSKVSPKSELWIVPETDHVKSYQKNPAEYIQKVTNYFNRNLK